MGKTTDIAKLVKKRRNAPKMIIGGLAIIVLSAVTVVPPLNNYPEMPELVQQAHQLNYEVKDSYTFTSDELFELTTDDISQYKVIQEGKQIELNQLKASPEYLEQLADYNNQKSNFYNRSSFHFVGMGLGLILMLLGVRRGIDSYDKLDKLGHFEKSNS
ncbi:MAG: hypothetical protein ABIB43_05950 [archaeon]